jgi:hypothetical protein
LHADIQICLFTSVATASTAGINMRIAVLICPLFLASAALAGNWLGVKPKQAKPAQAEIATLPIHAPAVKADTLFLDRKVISIPVGTTGTFLGTLEGVRCFNCTPDVVQLNLGDSISSEAATLSMRVDVWNAIERPMKDRRIFDYGNRCFYFGHKDVDTAFVGGEWTEIRVQDLPCFPYLQRNLNPHRFDNALATQTASKPIASKVTEEDTAATRSASHVEP